MNLYLVSIHGDHDYDQYDAMVVAAQTTEHARLLSPVEGEAWNAETKQWGKIVNGEWKVASWYHPSWPTTPAEAIVELIGKAKPGTKPGVILASFHAG